eukprot:TRINITY_DN7252_c0_g2_i1.p1 TRINITY_DN7252_c0_g2~~TRINITY_DN7252_c0_g2_i1.p1  ORF type:complete len:436 (+),score=92.29 TRINITY_DN7252_c0_g2_i1:187-1494(+)
MAGKFCTEMAPAVEMATGGLTFPGLRQPEPELFNLRVKNTFIDVAIAEEPECTRDDVMTSELSIVRRRWTHRRIQSSPAATISTVPAPAWTDELTTVEEACNSPLNTNVSVSPARSCCPKVDKDTWEACRRLERLACEMICRSRSPGASTCSSENEPEREPVPDCNSPAMKAPGRILLTKPPVQSRQHSFVPPSFEFTDEIDRIVLPSKATCRRNQRRQARVSRRRALGGQTEMADVAVEVRPTFCSSGLKDAADRAEGRSSFADVLSSSSAAATATAASASSLTPQRRDAARVGKQGKIFCHIYLHPRMLESAEFALIPKLIGKGGCNTRAIWEATGVKVRVRGRGSGHTEPGTKREADCHLMMALAAETGQEENLKEAVKLAQQRLHDVCKRYSNFCWQKYWPEPRGELFWIPEASEPTLVTKTDALYSQSQD